MVPSSVGHSFEIDVNGVLGVKGKPTSGNHWVEGRVTVQVTNGLLSVSNAPGARNNKLDYIDISEM